LTFNNVENPQETQTNHFQFDTLPSVKFRSPTVHDGHAVTALIKNSPPLDNNSAYCNLLQCTHFAQTCVIAESDNRIVGWLSAYIPPNQLDHIFVWQLAVHQEARGKGLAKHLLSALLNRQALAKVRYLITTITQDNQASWSVFERFATSHQLHLDKTPYFEKEPHFNGVHETEFLAKIGPFDIQKILSNQGV
jgi:L-2,4-diaminobutyric acid acetyltransferase